GGGHLGLGPYAGHRAQIIRVRTVHHGSARRSRDHVPVRDETRVGLIIPGPVSVHLRARLRVMHMADGVHHALLLVRLGAVGDEREVLRRTVRDDAVPEERVVLAARQLDGRAARRVRVLEYETARAGRLCADGTGKHTKRQEPPHAGGAGFFWALSTCRVVSAGAGGGGGGGAVPSGAIGPVTA